MDEAYYFMGGKNLFEGKGFQEMIIWNYLDDPVGLPHPSHLYWMPGASLVAFIGMFFFASPSYFAACFLFALIAALIPVITYLLGFRMLKNRSLALLAAGFSLAGGYYFVYYSAVETFSIYTILGAMFLATAGFPKLESRNFLALQAGALGILAGLMHLFRADGILWVGIGCAIILVNSVSMSKQNRPGIIRHFVLALLTLLSGYVLIMAPWYLRNIYLFSSLGVPGSSLSLFLLQYDDLYQFPAANLSLQNWLQSGLATILHARLKALGINLMSLLGVQHLVFLLPFVLLSMWKNRKEKITIYFLFSWLAILFVMSFIFPFAGSRGGYFHSGSAVQIWIYIYAASGFGELMQILQQKRNWNVKQATRVLGIGFLGIFFLVSMVITVQELIGDPSSEKLAWSAYGDEFHLIDAELTRLGIGPTDAILINDPPSNHVFTQRPGFAIPNGDEHTVKEVMEYYDIRYMVLQKNHPIGLNSIAEDGTSEVLELLYTGKGFSVWELK